MERRAFLGTAALLSLPKNLGGLSASNAIDLFFPQEPQATSIAQNLRNQGALIDIHFAEKGELTVYGWLEKLAADFAQLEKNYNVARDAQINLFQRNDLETRIAPLVDLLKGGKLAAKLYGDDFYDNRRQLDSKNAATGQGRKFLSSALKQLEHDLQNYSRYSAQVQAALREAEKSARTREPLVRTYFDAEEILHRLSITVRKEVLDSAVGAFAGVYDKPGRDIEEHSRLRTLSIHAAAYMGIDAIRMGWNKINFLRSVHYFGDDKTDLSKIPKGPGSLFFKKAMLAAISLANIGRIDETLSYYGSTSYRFISGSWINDNRLYDYGTRLEWMQNQMTPEVIAQVIEKAEGYLKQFGGK